MQENFKGFKLQNGGLKGSFGACQNLPKNRKHLKQGLTCLFRRFCSIIYGNICKTRIMIMVNRKIPFQPRHCKVVNSLTAVQITYLTAPIRGNNPISDVWICSTSVILIGKAFEKLLMTPSYLQQLIPIICVGFISANSG